MSKTKNKAKTTAKKLPAFALAAMMAASMMPLVPGQNAYADTVTTLKFTSSGITADGAAAEGCSIDGTALKITAAGNYEISGSCAEGTIQIGNNLNGVNLTLKDLTLASASAAPVIIGKNTTAAVILSGASELTDNDTDDQAVIKAKSGSSVTFSGSGSLAVNGNTKNGIKGAEESSLIFSSGTYDAAAVKNAIAADGSVTISGGSFDIDAGGDGIKADPDADDTVSEGRVTISGGSFDIDSYGDGIQGVTVGISGGSLDIDTFYENAGVNFYNKSLSKFNTLTSSETTKTETVNIDTGSHKGIKAGIKAETFSYTSVAEGSAYTAGTKYTRQASGGLIISGGTIDVNTTGTGIKYNSGDAGGQGRSSGNSGNLTAVDSKIILGAPEDGIKSQNTCDITGGKVTVNAADDGISVVNTLNITGSAEVDVRQAYEGIEAKIVNVGTSGASSGPTVSVYACDDGINTAGKSFSYVYADEDEEQYTKTTVSSTSGNDMTVYSGEVNVTIGDDTSHSYKLPVSSDYSSYTGGTTVSGTYSANGDGIDCNGSFLAKGGKTIVWGMSGNSDNTAVDVNNTYMIAGGEVLTAAGQKSGMDAGPTLSGQYAVEFSGSISSGKTLSVKDSSGNVLISAAAPKSVGYIMYSSPALSSGSSYSLYEGSAEKASAAAGSAVTASGQPGQSGFTPGNGAGQSNQPGQSGFTPENGADQSNQPGQSGFTPGNGADQSGQPGQSGFTPGSDTGQSSQPGQDQTGTETDRKPADGGTSGQDTADSAAAAGSTFTADGQTYVITAAAGTGAGQVAFTEAADRKVVIIPRTVTADGRTYKVTAIAEGAFANSRACRLIVKTRALTKAGVRGCLTGSKIKVIKVKCGKKAKRAAYVKKYSKFFSKANAGRKVTVK